MSIATDIPQTAAGSLTARLVRRIMGSSLLTKSGLSVFDQGVVSGTSFATSVLLGRFVAAAARERPFVRGRGRRCQRCDRSWDRSANASCGQYGRVLSRAKAP